MTSTANNRPAWLREFDANMAETAAKRAVERPCQCDAALTDDAYQRIEFFDQPYHMTTDHR